MYFLSIAYFSGRHRDVRWVLCVYTSILDEKKYSPLHIHIWSTRIYTYVQHAYTHMFNTHIHTCSIRVYTHVQHPKTLTGYPWVVSEDAWWMFVYLFDHLLLRNIDVHLYSRCTSIFSYFYVWHLYSYISMCDIYIYIPLTTDCVSISIRWFLFLQTSTSAHWFLFLQTTH